MIRHRKTVSHDGLISRLRGENLKTMDTGFLKKGSRKERLKHKKLHRTLKIKTLYIILQNSSNKNRNKEYFYLLGHAILGAQVLLTRFKVLYKLFITFVTFHSI